MYTTRTIPWRGLRRGLLMASLIAGLLTCASCKQAEGERCQITDDCTPGLTCVLFDGANPKSGGVCKGTGTVTTTPDLSNTVNTPDMSTPPDMTVVDLTMGG